MKPGRVLNAHPCCIPNRKKYRAEGRRENLSRQLTGYFVPILLETGVVGGGILKEASCTRLLFIQRVGHQRVVRHENFIQCLECGTGKIKGEHCFAYLKGQDCRKLKKKKVKVPRGDQGNRFAALPSLEPRRCHGCERAVEPRAWRNRCPVAATRRTVAPASDRPGQPAR
eukprot:5497017-Amphidinium_carterae.1